MMTTWYVGLDTGTHHRRYQLNLSLTTSTLCYLLHRRAT